MLVNLEQFPIVKAGAARRAAAAAALALYVTLPGGEAGVAEDPGLEPPSDDLLAALPELEAYAFMAGELEPLEEDALFLLEPTDELVLELLDEE